MRKANEDEANRVVLVSDTELEKRNVERIPQGTRDNTKWTVGILKQWAEIRNSKAVEGGDDLRYVEPNILPTHATDNDMNYWLGKFVVEIRKKKPCGEPYPPNTPCPLCCGVQRYFRENGRADLNLSENVCFKTFQDSLNGEMKSLAAGGYGAIVKEAEAFTEDQEEKLCTLKLLGDHSAQVLLDTMVFLIGKKFCFAKWKTAQKSTI